MLGYSKLYAILDLDYVDVADAVVKTSALLDGGADLLQLRAKGVGRESIRKVALDLMPLCREAGVPFILNDDPDLAADIKADGLHIGQDDGHYAFARSIVGDHMYIGRSTHSLTQARAALEEGFDYIGFGPLFATPTKPGRPAIGMQDIAQMQREVGSRIPAFCIGGIKRDNLEQVMSAGAERVAIVSDLLTAIDTTAATAEVVAKL